MLTEITEQLVYTVYDFIHIKLQYTGQSESDESEISVVKRVSGVLHEQRLCRIYGN